MKQLIILTDDDYKFLISLDNLTVYKTMSVESIKSHFVVYGYLVDVIRFSELDLSCDYTGVYVLYQTSEYEGSFYKRYIEDIIYFLEQNGAIVLPKYEYLKAHHNKGYMELLKTTFKDEALKTVKSKYYGNPNIKNTQNFPMVIKQISGSGSDGVYLAHNDNEYNKAIKKVSQTVIGNSIFHVMIKKIKNNIKRVILWLKKDYRYNISEPIYRSFIVQTFIEGLEGDYKVLYFGGKYYMLYRKNRENDFRASGGGQLFDVPEEEREGLLSFAHRLVMEIDFPIIGMDIGFDGTNYHLLEFQMIHLGPYTLQAANYWHEFIDNKWVRFEGKSDLEEEFSRSIYEYIEGLCV